MKRIQLISFVILFLTGCADFYKTVNPVGYQLEQEEKALEQAKVEKLRCQNQYEETLEFSLIRPLMPYKPDDATFAQLSNKSKPSKAEKIAIEAFDDFSQRCFKTVMFYYKAYNPAKWRISLAEAYQQNERDLLLQLFDSKISYGEYNGLRIKLLQKKNEIEEEESRKRRQGMVNDLLMLQALGVMNSPKAAPVAPAVQPQRPFNAPGTVVNPIQTNCTNVGGSVNCQTYSY